MKRKRRKPPELCIGCHKWAPTVRLFLRDLDLRTAQKLLGLPANKTPHVYDYPQILVCKFCAIEALGDTDERVLELERNLKDMREAFEVLRRRIAVLEENEEIRADGMDSLT